MIRSMTAYGRATGTVGGREITVELRSVNNRFFDCNIKLPRAYGYLEDKIKALLSSRDISRGKLEVFVSINVISSADTELYLDCAYLEQYLSALRRLRDEYGLADDISVMNVAKNSDIFIRKKQDEDTEREWENLLPVLNEALSAFILMREAEGETLRCDLIKKRKTLEEIIGMIKLASEETAENYRQRLEQKLRTVLEGYDISVDEQRIVTECAVFADRIATDEELVRLGSHLAAFDNCLASPEPVGRKLDFLLQEMNREINTIGSKANDAAVAKLVVDAKSELEKIREQIQNLE